MRFFIIVAFVIMGLDALVLNFLAAFNFKYFVTLHLVLFTICFSLILLKNYLQKAKPNYVGLGTTTGFVFKMFVSLLIFIVLYKKMEMGNIHVINFLFIYLLYTFIAAITVVKE